jgi:hypothetical protein
VAVATVLMLGAATALAVNDDNLFELGPGVPGDEGGLTNILGDGNVANGPDWADLFDANGALIVGALGTYGGEAAQFIHDDISVGGTEDRTAFPKAGSDKNSDTVDEWNWQSASVPAKDDIANAYVYVKMDETYDPPHLIIYAGVERLDPSGASHLDIEFFQKPVALSEPPACDATTCTFTGENTDGDLLASMDFTNGGAFAGLAIHERKEGETNNYLDIEDLNAQGCNGADTICAFSNGGPINGGPWPNYDNHAAIITNLPTNSFTEFGVDVTAVLGFTPCFSSVMVKTRSSQSFTAELKDFALESLQQCSASAVTEIHTGDTVGATHVATDVQGTTIPSGTAVHDKAIVNGTPGFPAPTGTVTFQLYANAECTGTSVDEPVALTAVSASASAAESTQFTPGPGSISYSAVYGGDANYAGVTAACEPLTVARFTSTVTTDILLAGTSTSVMNTAVDTGTQVVDKATVTGSGGVDPTGSVTFRRFTTAGNCSGAFTDEVVPIVADADATDGIATVLSQTHTMNAAAGSFVSYQVSYSGDGIYDPAQSSVCEPVCQFTFTGSQTPPP